MRQVKLSQRLIRYDELIPCKAAFIDAKTPGSHLKDNYSIIGGGVSESQHQKVNLTLKHGFCIGAAGQPPRIKNSPHSHFTAEVFMVFKGTWNFYWNNDCQAQTTLYPGDIISLPTNMFRGFENIGEDQGMIFSILGHDDAGGGVLWLPSVLKEAQGHGLILLENGNLVDTTIGETIPKGLKPMPTLSEKELESFDQYTLEQMQKYVGRKGSYQKSVYKDFPTQSPEQITYFDIIGPLNSVSHNFHVQPGDKNGDQFNVYGLESSGAGTTGKYIRKEVEVMLVHSGEFEVWCMHNSETLCFVMKAGDIISFPENALRNISPKNKGFAYLVVGGDEPKAPILVEE